MSYFPKTKHSLFVLIGAFIAIGASFFFSGEDLIEALLLQLFFFVLFPLAFIGIVLKKSLKNYGFDGMITKQSLLYFIQGFFASLFVFLCFYFLFSLENTMRISGEMFQTFWLFFFQLFFVYGSLALFYEFFFRGFLQLGLQKELGFWAVLWQWGIFLSFLLLTKTFNWDSLDLIIASFFSSLLLYKTRSILLSFLFSWFFVILITLLYLIEIL
jgi:membrane protease YdiL (CAAX protease family)